MAFEDKEKKEELTSTERKLTKLKMKMKEEDDTKGKEERQTDYESLG